MFNLDKRTISIIVIIMIGIAVLQYVSNPSQLISLLVSAPGVLIAITFHEFAHGYAAYKLGDDTAKNQGRLSLNPLAHLDPVGTMLLLVAGFGWGKPVEVNPRNYTRKISMEKGEAIVSLAGPCTNFLIILISSYTKINIFSNLIIVYANLLIMIFNLIPIYPLDGGRILRGIIHMIVGKKEAEKYINIISFITLLIISFFASIGIYYIKNISLFFIIIFLWTLYINQDTIYKKRLKIYNLIEKTIEIEENK